MGLQTIIEQKLGESQRTEARRAAFSGAGGSKWRCSKSRKCRRLLIETSPPPAGLEARTTFNQCTCKELFHITVGRGECPS